MGGSYTVTRGPRRAMNDSHLRGGAPPIGACASWAIRIAKKEIKMIDFENKGFFKLKQNREYAEKVTSLLLEDEKIIDAYKSMRDGVVFTNKRIIAVNVQGLTGSKKDFTTLPYKNIVAYSIETSGTFDLDSELEIHFSSLGKVRFEFTGNTAIVEISQSIAQHLL